MTSPSKKPGRKDNKGNERNYISQMKLALIDNAYSDVVFQIEGEEVQAHKIVLAMRCPYFDHMFSSSFKA